MTSYVSADLRRLVETRADYLSEYCLVHEEDTYLGCQVDHIIAEKHHGETVAENLCFACTCCNRAKGTDIGSIARSTGEFTRFFHPRTDHWADHFALRGVAIEARSVIGEVTIALLGLNTSERIRERETLRQLGRYPPAEAQSRLTARG